MGFFDGGKEQLAMKLLDEGFLRSDGRIVDHIDDISLNKKDNEKQAKLRVEAARFLAEKGYAEYQGKGIYKITQAGMTAAKARRSGAR